MKESDYPEELIDMPSAARREARMRYSAFFGCRDG